MPATSDLLNRPCVSERIARQAHETFPGDGQKQQDMREAFLRGARAQLAEIEPLMARALVLAEAVDAAVTQVRDNLRAEATHAR